jgi:hypothetical protein
MIEDEGNSLFKSKVSMSLTHPSRAGASTTSRTC